MKRILFLLLIIHYSLFTAQAQWQQTSGPPGWAEVVNSLVVSGDTIFAGTDLGGVFLTTNSGATWNSLGLWDINCLAKSGKNIFAGIRDGSEGGVYLSTDNGASWDAVNKGLTNLFVNSLATNGTNIFAGTDGGVFLSTNNGSSWSAVNNGLPNTTVQSLTINGTNIFAGTGMGLFLSSDNGADWTARNNGLLDSLEVISLAISGKNIFAATYNRGMFLSTNNGASWSAVSNGLPDTTQYSTGPIVYNGSNIFIGTNDGVFLSTNNGASWNAVNSGLDVNDIVVTVLAISGKNIFAGTNFRGVWKRALSEMIGINELGIMNYELGIMNYELGIEVYPNPANSFIVVSYSLFKNNPINNSSYFEIYSIEGKEYIKQKITDNRTRIDISNLSEGVYLIKFTNNETVRVAKFIKANNF